MKEKKQRATKRGTKSEGIFPHRHNGEELIFLSNGGTSLNSQSSDFDTCFILHVQMDML